MEHLKAGNLTAACENFEKSQKIDPAVGTLLYLAECYERTRRTASAWATFREAASLARELRETERAAIGDQRAARLVPLLSRLTIDVTSVHEVPGLTVRQDGVPLNPALFGASVPIDPGKHVFSAEAPGYEPWTQEVEVMEGASSTTLNVPALVPKAAPAQAVEQPKTETVTPQPSTFVQTDAVPKTESSNAASWILMGGGLAFIGAGVGFGIHAKNLDDRALKECEGKLCATTDAEKLSDDAQQAALFSNIGYGVGAAAIITGGILLLIDAPQKGAEQVAAFHVAPTRSGGYVWYQGSF